jgi:branched-chain amino acid aminotransferase
MADLIPFDDRDGVIWFDGEMVPWRDAKVHVLSHAMHYASCVFEGERAYSRRIFKLSEHTERLFESAALLDMEIPFTPAEINAACIDLIARQDIVDGYVRPVAWRGSEMMGVSAQAAKTHVAIATWPWPNLFGDDRLDSGIRMKTSKWRRPAPNTAPVKAKAAGLYMICTLSRHSVEPEGYDDALMLDWRGQVAESTGANIFLVQNGVIHTPTPDCFLDGITRRTVMDLARKRGYEVVERVIMPEDLAHADEVFLTGTAAEVTPVGEIDEHNYQVGPITRQLMDDYEAEVRKGD